MKDVSWANIRDRLAFHQFDVAHMLAPMVVASKLGLGSNPSPTVTPFALGRGGNAITLSVGLYKAMQEAAGLDGSEDARANGRALKMVVEARRRSGERPLVFGMTYPFSSHNYEFRFWMGAAGIHPDRDVTMTVVPPPFTADAMAAGAIDGFCVNAPWNVIAVERGVGRIVAVKADIWPSSPEKVLGVRPAWAEANAETLSRLMVALDAAARWCDAPENRPALAAMLAEDAYVGAPEGVIRPLLLDRLVVDPDGRSRAIPNYLSYHRQAANFPWVSHALWTFSQMMPGGRRVIRPKAPRRRPPPTARTSIGTCWRRAECRLPQQTCGSRAIPAPPQWRPLAARSSSHPTPFSRPGFRSGRHRRLHQGFRHQERPRNTRHRRGIVEVFRLSDEQVAKISISHLHNIWS